MARKRYGEDDILRLIREVEVHCNFGMDVVSSCRTAGVSDKTYYGWRRKYGGMNLLASLSPSYTHVADRAAHLFPTDVDLPMLDSMVSGLFRAQNVYVIGRGAGLGAAQEVALKLKECCALHAEAYSASEVLHGPL